MIEGSTMPDELVTDDELEQLAEEDDGATGSTYADLETGGTYTDHEVGATYDKLERD